MLSRKLIALLVNIWVKTYTAVQQLNKPIVGVQKRRSELYFHFPNIQQKKMENLFWIRINDKKFGKADKLAR